MHQELAALTSIPTAAGHEDRVIAWIRDWVSRRDGLRLKEDQAGNLLISPTHRRHRAPIVVVAHMDHPGFVVDEVDGRRVSAWFRGGVLDAYFEGARVEFFTASGSAHRGRVSEWDRDTRLAGVLLDRAGPLGPGDIGRWFFPARTTGVRGDLLRAPACDDLAGVAAALVAIDAALADPKLAHMSLLLTRAEEVGFLGAIAACKLGSVPAGARVVSVETSRALPGIPIGGGPVVRVGDASTVFDSALTNAIASIAANSGRPVQRKLMDGGSCEATAFGAYGFTAAGLALPLGNYHNMKDIDGVRSGAVDARLAPEEISQSDFDGLVALLLDVARDLDQSGSTLVDRLDEMYEESRSILDRSPAARG